MRLFGVFFLGSIVTLCGAAQQIPTHLRVLQPCYVSPSGTDTGSGTLDSPWSLNAALSRGDSNLVITLLPGTYPSITVRTPGLILQSSEKWAARIVGSPGRHGIAVMAGASNVVLDGFEIAGSYLDGVKLNTGGNTVRNCWIHHSGRGNPSAQTNSDGSYSGQGIYASCQAGDTIEYNLIEQNGAWNGHDHGIYISGTNHVIRGNVVRYNWAFGLQLYTEYTNQSCSGIKVHNNLVYGNGVGNGGGNCLTVWAGSPGNGTGTTNYVFNNTLLAATYYPVICDGGYLALTNNIILGAYDGSLAAVDGGTIWCDYNLLTNAIPARKGIVDGGHNLQAADPGFVNAGHGLFWLSSSSRARDAALRASFSPVDFFGRRLTLVSDIGAFQYDPNLAADTRELDPSHLSPDYWKLP